MDTWDNLAVKQSAGALSMHTPGHSSYLEYIRSMVCSLSRTVGFSEEEVAKIEMSVDEACSNIIEHAYEPETKWCWQHRAPEIRLNMRVENKQLIIEINDHGQRFDFTAHCHDSIEEGLRSMHTGGYGISIIRQFMDEVGYTSSDTTGNTVRLIKYLPTFRSAVHAESRH